MNCQLHDLHFFFICRTQIQEVIELTEIVPLQSNAPESEKSPIKEHKISMHNEASQSLNDGLLKDCLATKEKLESVKYSATNLTKSDISNKFPDFKNRTASFCASVEIYINMFQERLTQIFQMQGTNNPEEEKKAGLKLVNFLINSKRSVFSLAFLENWLNLKEREESLLTNVIKFSTEEVIFDHQRLLQFHSDKKCLVGLEINAFREEDMFLIAMKQFIEALSKGQEISNHGQLLI